MKDYSGLNMIYGRQWWAYVSFIRGWDNCPNAVSKRSLTFVVRGFSPIIIVHHIGLFSPCKSDNCTCAKFSCVYSTWRIRRWLCRLHGGMLECKYNVYQRYQLPQNYKCLPTEILATPPLEILPAPLCTPRTIACNFLLDFELNSQNLSWRCILI